MLIDITPVGYRELVTLFFSNKTVVVLLLYKRSLGITLSDKVIYFIVCWVVVFGSRDRRNSLILKSQILERISGMHHYLRAVQIKDICHYLRQVLLGLYRVIIRIIFWQDFVENHASQSSITNLFLGEHTDRRLKRDDTLVISHLSFIYR